MDLRLLHLAPEAGRDHRIMDKMNSWTGRFPCRFLEWSGWYNYGIALRLLGHYRLFQHYKADDSRTFRDLPAPQAYILQYRGGHGLKYIISRIIGMVYALGTWKEYYKVVEIAGINRLLVTSHAAILLEFLETADEDFDQAIKTAIQRIKETALFGGQQPGRPGTAMPPNLVQYNHTENNYESATFNEVNFHTVIKEGAAGKARDVFSKKQILILFDLLAESGKIERIDFNKTARFESLALLLHALTGKNRDSFLEELKDHRTQGLYEFHTPGELRQLIGILSNLENTFRNAGFRSVAGLAAKKIKELESTKKDE